MFARNRPKASTPEPVLEPLLGPGYQALRFLSSQDLEHTPDNYALAWRVKIDRRSLAAMAIDSILMDGRKVTQADMDRITLANNSSELTPELSPNPVEEALRHNALRLAELTADATAQSSAFGRDLSTGLFELAGGDDSIEQIVRAMVHRTRGVEAQLTEASQEIENLRGQMEAVRDDAQRDALTGLLNRKGVLQELGARNHEDIGVLAMCDVDHFKSINDRFGHSVGDRVLKGVAASLADSAGVHVVGRWGGEEFLILIDRVDFNSATRLLDRARKNLATRAFKLRETDEPIGAVTMSIGAVSLAGRTVEESIEAADRMLYLAKHEGRNRVITERAESLSPSVRAG